MIDVSVIVPVYNSEEHIKLTLQKLRQQTLKNIEVIIVNDGSDDYSPEICRDFCAEDSRFKLVNKENGGVSSARNMGISLALGEYLMFCDADDLPCENQAQRLLEKAKSENADIVLCDFEKFSYDGSVAETLPYFNSITSKTDRIKKLIMPMCVWGYAPGGKKMTPIYGSVCRGLYKKSFIDENGIIFPTETGLGEDMLFNMQAFAKSEKTAFVREGLYIYVEHPLSATHSNYHLLWEKYLITWRLAHESLKTISYDREDLRWHNFQLTRYAVSAVIEGVCSQKLSYKRKKAAVKEILGEKSLKTVLKDLPVNLGKKDRLLCAMLNPLCAAAVLKYYQRIYDTEYRRI